MRVLAQKRIFDSTHGLFVLRVTDVAVDPTDGTKIRVTVSATREDQGTEAKFTLAAKSDVCRRNQVCISRNRVIGKMKLSSIILGFIYRETTPVEGEPGIAFLLPVERFGVGTLFRWSQTSQTFKR